MLDRFSLAVLETSSTEEFLHRLLEILVDVAAVDVAVVRLREGNLLRSRAAIGLEEESVPGFSLTIDECLPARVGTEGGLPVFSDNLSDACWSKELRNKGLRGLYCLPLDGTDRVGVVYLGAREGRSLSDEQKQLLATLAPRAAAAVSKYIDHEILHQRIRSRDELLGVVAHDLRNPLNVISLAANTLLPRVPDSSARRPVERILRAAQRADRLIQDLLDANAIEGGRFSIDTHSVETSDPILAALESQQSIAASASIILATDLSPELPPVEADEERILEVLENLIGNAIKFTGPGGSVTVGASAGEREILFWVKDSGSGIPAEQLPHLFDRFWQASKRDRRGRGLGLTICKAIVEAHGGRIWAETRPGEGTTMFFTIPANARPSGSGGPAEVVNLLLVDDRPENLLSLKAILERPDYRLLAATSGEEALGLILRERFSVALIDIAMPGMDGLEVAVHLKELERSRDIPILFITAFGDDPQEIHRAYAAGGADYLVKPLDPEIVRKKVAVFVGLSQRRYATAHPEEHRPSDT